MLPAWLDGALLATATHSAPVRNAVVYMVQLRENLGVVDTVAALETDRVDSGDTADLSTVLH